MATQFQAGAVLYAKDLVLVQRFYQAVTGLQIEDAKDGYVVLGSSAFQLVILRMPERIASSVSVERPPGRRTEVQIKLVFSVASIAAVREAAAFHGGELNPPEREWKFQGSLVCDGQDPEGNVVQFRQSIR